MIFLVNFWRQILISRTSSKGSEPCIYKRDGAAEAALVIRTWFNKSDL
jgi:hypothetical protein